MAKVPNLKNALALFAVLPNSVRDGKSLFLRTLCVNIILWIILWKLCITLILQGFFQVALRLCFDGRGNIFRIFPVFEQKRREKVKK